MEIGDNGQVALLVEDEEGEIYTVRIFDSIKMENSWDFTIKRTEFLKEDEEIQ